MFGSEKGWSIFGIFVDFTCMITIEKDSEALVMWGMDYPIAWLEARLC